MSVICSTHQISKSYHGIDVVQNISMTIRKGEIYGFLGPNGAGKTTVMKMLTNLVKPTAGYVKLFDQVLTPTSYDLLKRIGSMIEAPIFYEHLNARENLTAPGIYRLSRQMVNRRGAGARRFEACRHKTSARIFTRHEAAARDCKGDQHEARALDSR